MIGKSKPVTDESGKLESRKKASSDHSREFRLVVWFLGALVFLVFAVVSMPADYITGRYDSEAGEVIEFKKELLSILLTAFGAWIGAGAAYFFGRENLREAYAGMRSLQRRTPDEILRATLIKDLPPRGVEYTVKPTDSFSSVKQRLWQEKTRWFFIYVNEDGEFVAAIDEEEIWRLRAEPQKYYRLGKGSKAVPFDDAKLDDSKTKMQEILVAIAVYNRTKDVDKNNQTKGAGDRDEAAKKELVNQETGEIIKSLNQAVKFNADASAWVAEQTLNEAGLYLGVVTDDAKRPTGYFTTGDIRRSLTGSMRNTDH